MNDTKNDAGDGDLREKVIEALKTCYDPEIPVNIYELGLIYTIDVPSDDPAEKDEPTRDRPKEDEAKNAPAGPTVVVTMTLTSPACPVAGILPTQVEQKVRSIPEVADARVELVWEPPWTPELMSEAAKLQLNMF